ncbi:MAG TPA: 50S ribosomal protein L4 [Candidatus Paceibacterota bacterium]|nr:50S ribosomal protein L4 [Candidatus Paceibacterota bacterium]
MAETTTSPITHAPTASLKKAPSLEAVVYSQEGAKVTSITLPATLFGRRWNADLVHQVATAMMANARAGTAHTKDRSEVSGGGKKPWRQKGTGRARHGSTRSPLWVGGGTTFGPRNEKEYAQKINKKSRARALFTVLSQKYALGNILFLEEVTLPAIKTKTAAALLHRLSTLEGFERMAPSKKKHTLIVVPARTETMDKSFANLPSVAITAALDLNVVTALKCRYLIIVDPTSTLALLESKLK